MRNDLVTMLPHVVDGPLCIQKSEQIIKFVGALLVAIIYTASQKSLATCFLYAIKLP